MVPVDHEWVAVIADDLERTVVGSNQLALRLKFTLAFTLEQIERSGKVASDQIQVAVAVPIDGHGPSADDVDNPVVLLVFFFQGNEQRLLIRALERFGSLKRTVRFTPQDLK